MIQVAGYICEYTLKHILPRLERGQREYGRSVRSAEGPSGYSPLGSFVVRATRTHRANANPLAEIEIVSGCNEGNHARASESLVVSVSRCGFLGRFILLFLFGGFSFSSLRHP